MKKMLLSLIGLFSIALHSQVATVEKSTFGVQTGFFGIWIHNEARLANSVALRSELGLDMGIFGNDIYSYGYLFVPVITAEPRWYYNLQKRASKMKRTDGNSANLVSVKTSYHPDLIAISDRENLHIVPDISIVPTWGIRRNVGRHFTYEAGFGVGYVYYFAKSAGYENNEDDVAVNAHLRIGYRF